MKNVLSCALVLAFTFCWVSAQEKRIDEASYNEVVSKAAGFLKSEKFRTKTTVETCNNEKCDWKIVETSFMEQEEPGKRRHYGFIETPRGMEPMAERRFLSDKVYVKRAGSSWQIEKQVAPTRQDSTKYDAKLEFKDLGIERIGPIEMRVLLKTAFIRSTLNGVENIGMQSTKSWLDARGRFKKVEYFWRLSGNATRRTVFYEVDPTIKIEAPLN